MFERNSPTEEVFSEAWEQVRAGRSIEAVLAGYPGYAAELEPMLRLAAAVQTVPAPTLSPHALGRIHLRAQAAATLRVPSTKYRVPSGLRGLGTRYSVLGTRYSVLGTRYSVLAIRLAAVALLLIVAGAAIMIALLMNRSPGGTPVETYSGVIKEMAATQWLVDDTHVVIDSKTQIHGLPAVGAEITCLAVALQPGDRVRALEVWVNTRPGTPTPAPTRPAGEGSAPIMALAP